MEGKYWSDVRQEPTSKVEIQSLQDGCKTGHGGTEQTVGQLEIRGRGNCIQLKCAGGDGQEERQD